MGGLVKDYPIYISLTYEKYEVAEDLSLMVCPILKAALVTK